MAPNAAVCLVLCGAALLGALAPGVRGKAATVIGAAGAVTLALGIASLAGYLTGIPMHAWGKWTRMAANAEIGFVAMGVGIQALAWQYAGRGRAKSAHWMALAGGCGGLTLSLSLAFALSIEMPEHRALPTVVMVVGALISALLVVIVELAFTSRRRAEAAESANEELRAANSELAAIHANAPVVLLVVDDQLRVEKVNAMAERFAGRSHPEMPGVRPGDAIGCLHSLDDPQGCGHGTACGDCPVRRAVVGCLRGGIASADAEAWLPFSAGGQETRRCLHVSVAPLQVNGKAKALICAEDLTSRRQSELELQRRAELIDLAHDAIIDTDPHRVIRGWNTGAEEIYGWTAAEARGRTLHTLLQTKGAAPAEIDTVLADAGRWEGELVHTRSDGREIVVESRQVLVRDRDGAPAGILEINRDVTGRKRAEEKLAAAHRTTATILDGISDGFNSFDRDWRYTYVNAAAARLVRKTPEELLGRNLWDLWPHAADSPFGIAYRRAVAEGIPTRVEAFYPEPLNTWFEVRCYPSAEGLSLFFTDTTERKRAEEKLQDTVRALERALAEKTVLLKEVHHRVKNNLAVIASLLSMRAGAAESAEARAALEDSQQRVYAISLIHEHLYGSDRLDRIDFAAYARQLVDQLYAASNPGPGRVTLDFASDPIELGIHRAVPCALILNELLSNVFKHAFPGGRQGRVWVEFREGEARTAELVVEDDGVGLPPGWEDSKSLGWQIVRILARQLDGTLSAEPSPGTRFVMRFPLGSGGRMQGGPAAGSRESPVNDC